MFDFILIITIFIIVLAVFATPILVIIIVHYILLKYYQIVQDLEQTINTLRNNIRGLFKLQYYVRLLRINRQYSLLNAEIRRYNQQMRSVISVLISGYCIFISYSIYVLLFTQLPLVFIIPFILCTMFITLYLTTLIWWCSKLSNMNKQIGRMNNRFLSTNFMAGKYSAKLIKVCFVFTLYFQIILFFILVGNDKPEFNW